MIPYLKKGVVAFVCIGGIGLLLAMPFAGPCGFTSETVTQIFLFSCLCLALALAVSIGIFVHGKRHPSPEEAQK